MTSPKRTRRGKRRWHRGPTIPPRGASGSRRKRGGLPARLGRWPLIRMQLTGAIIALLFAGLVIRAWNLQVERAEHYREAALRQHLASQKLAAPRGVIRDAAGRELAVTADAASVWVDPTEVENLAATAEALARLFDHDLLGLEQKLASERRFVWIRRHVSDDLAQAARALNLPGVHVSYEPRRYYPGRTLAGPVFGFANIDGVGIEGLELSMDELLRGKSGSRQALRDARGKLMLTAAPADETESGETPEPGATVTVTLDRSVQDIAQRALERAVEEHQAAAGSIVVLDVESGGVLAMANWPTYNPNRPSQRKDARNRAITDAFEMGSVMKVFTVAGALEAGAVQPDQVFDIEGGRIRIGRKVIRDTHAEDELDVAGILKHSSNVGTIKIARELGKDALHATLERFGFGRTTGIELPGERSGLMHPTRRWGELGLASVSYGYMMLVTPLQVAAGYAAIGNGGIYHEPRLVKEVVGEGGEVLYHHEIQGRRVLSEQTSKQLLPMLAGVFDKGRHGGTARSIDIDGYRAGGKTGTSHKVDPETHTYSDELYLSSFAGLAPIDDPRIAVVVMIDEPRGEHYYGAQVAGPAFAEVVEGTLRYLGLPADPALSRSDDDAEGRGDADDDDHRGHHRAHADPPPAQAPPPGGPLRGPGGAGAAGGLVRGDPGGAPPADEGDRAARAAPAASDQPGRIPDFRGLSVVRALERARRRGVGLVIEGSGIAVRQSPAPGELADGAECRVVFASPRPVPRPAAPAPANNPDRHRVETP